MAPSGDRKLRRASIETASPTYSRAASDKPALGVFGKTMNLLGLGSEGTGERDERCEEKQSPKQQLKDLSQQLVKVTEELELFKRGKAEDLQKIEHLTDHVSTVTEQRDKYRERAEGYLEQLQGAQAETHELRAENHELRKKLQNEEADKRSAQGQLVHYKTLISASSQAQHQVSDDVIRAKSDEVFHSIQNFVAKYFRGAKIEVSRINGKARYVMYDYAPSAEKLPKPLWLNFLQSLISQVMVDSFKPENFFGLAGKTPALAAKELATTFGRVDMDPKWATLTRKLLSENAQEALTTSDGHLAGSLARRVYDELHIAVPIEWTPDMREKLVAIFERAQELYRLVYSQQSDLEVWLPKAMANGTVYVFQPDLMEAVNGGHDDEATLKQAELEISVFPGVYKMNGEAHGGSKHITTIAKAKVIVCE